MVNFQHTKEQARFITESRNELVLIACPGSGKTDSGIQRFVDHCLADPNRGRAYLSFTTVAVDEALRRLREMGAEEVAAYPNAVSTIDGFFRNYVFDPFVATLDTAGTALPAEIQVLPDLPPYPPQIVSDKTFDIWGVRPIPRSGRNRPLKTWEVQMIVDADDYPRFRYKNDAEEWILIDQGRFAQIARQKVDCIRRGFATFNEIMMFSYFLLKSKKRRVAEIVSARFCEMIVDEAQDTSVLQQAMLKFLAARGSKISYIGDPKQCIYMFNDANPAYLTDLVASGHSGLSLTRNFRSSPEIVAVVNAHFGTEMKTERETPRGCGAYLHHGDWESSLARFKGLLDGCKVESKDAAVLVRNRNHLGNVLSDVKTDNWSMAPRYALGAWRQERAGRFDRCSEIALRLLRAIVDDCWEGFENENTRTGFAWKCLRKYCPEPVDGETPRQWAERLKERLEAFISESRVPRHKAFGVRVSPARLQAKGDAKALFSFPLLRERVTVIHQVKGETIRAVLVVAPPEQHRVWLDNQEAEESNICYVAFTRAADLLVLQCSDMGQAEEWRKRGFVSLS